MEPTGTFTDLRRLLSAKSSMLKSVLIGTMQHSNQRAPSLHVRRLNLTHTEPPSVTFRRFYPIQKNCWPAGYLLPLSLGRPGYSHKGPHAKRQRKEDLSQTAIIRSKSINTAMADHTNGVALASQRSLAIANAQVNPFAISRAIELIAASI